MNKLIKELQSLGVVNKDRLEVYYPRVRDRADIKILRDRLTEVILLSKSDHIDKKYYKDRSEKKSYTVFNTEVKTPRLHDNIRRANDFSSYINNKNWLDFGCGLGGMLDEIGSNAKKAFGLEPNIIRANYVKSKGHKVVNDLDEIKDNSLDTISLFHVLEHITEPLKILKILSKKLKPKGKVIIEVPHARDVLFTLYDCKKFKQFTFWSEHLVLHTRLSLKALLDAASFDSTEIIGYQRYQLQNHLYWLSKGKPGGHEEWQSLNSKHLDNAYSERLNAIDRTDTLIAVAKVK
jgi:2-polyprenyl-3-methyl-5-hydroxy-6-metoxy-1,4-benzoquinol methylase